MTLPSAPSIGTGTPQSKSRVIARGCSPSPAFNQLMHWPITFGFQSFLDSKNSRKSPESLSRGKNQFVVFFISGTAPDKALLGLIRSVAFSEAPQLSHWSP